jgi:hypothetical protein
MITEVTMTPPDDDSGTDLDTLAANRDGRATALAVLSPLPRFWVRPLKTLLWVKSRLGPDKMLRRLEFIHVAHWNLIEHFPGETSPTRYAYLMFASNFNGSWLDYLDDFSVTIPQKMTLLWGSSFGFPGSIPPRPFTDYIRRNDKPLNHYYSAYPQASTTEIASALRVEAGFSGAGGLKETLNDFADLVSMSDEALLKAWEGYLSGVQRDL